MTDKQSQSLKPPPTTNYSSAIARAVEWLGDRYLLAKPIKAAPGLVGATHRHPNSQDPGQPR